ncbi:isochorismatase family protein [Marinomonas transparens]|uniref:Isochorismatase family protein n=1 Tax=Marinomonas transparens TaxID=2795388 RepID=A0A934JW21_9GAMM|nr:isochorismatase family protein [Marinomonas transparens]MBJ7539312.1 isochorismatase family protein [Marinomonas transparens]
MLDKQKTGLIVIDIQGRLADIVYESELVIANSVKLVNGAKALNLPILWLEQTPDKIGSTVSQLKEVLDQHQPITKHTFSAGGSAEFVQAVKASSVEAWLLCGIETHICVYQTALDLLSLGYQVELVEDCVSSRTLLNKDLAITKLAGKGVTTTSLEMCLYELLGDSQAAEFKEILKLTK